MLSVVVGLTTSAIGYNFYKAYSKYKTSVPAAESVEADPNAAGDANEPDAEDR